MIFFKYFFVRIVVALSIPYPSLILRSSFAGKNYEF